MSLILILETDRPKDAKPEPEVVVLTKNQKIILDIIDEFGEASRPTIVRESGLARTTVYDALKKLERQGVVEPFLYPRIGRGRPKTKWGRNGIRDQPTNPS